MKVSPYTRPEAYLESRGVPLSAANDDELYALRSDSVDISPGEAIVLAAAIWISEHWRAVIIGLAVGMAIVLLPAIIVARFVS